MVRKMIEIEVRGGIVKSIVEPSQDAYELYVSKWRPSKCERQFLNYQ
jgi:hypothetical protein